MQPDGVVSTAHFIQLTTPCNVYSTRVVVGFGKREIVLVATSSQVFMVSWDVLEETRRGYTITKLPLTFPDDASIVSMDTCVCSATDGSLRLLVGVALAPSRGSARKAVLRFYRLAPSSASLLPVEVDGVHEIELSYLPFKLTHLEVPIYGGQRQVFFLPGSDQTIHGYGEREHSGRFEEVDVASSISGFLDLPSGVLSLDILHIGDTLAIALGCQDGHVRVSTTRVGKSTPERHTHSLKLDGPISSVLFVPARPIHRLEDAPIVSRIHEEVRAFEPSSPSAFRSPTEEGLHLCVCEAVGTAILYRGVLQYGLARPIMLPESDKHDSVTCACVADFSFDGRNNLFVGTYGQTVLMYNIPVSGEGDAPPRLVWRKTFAHPVLSIVAVDINGDAVDELVVTTMYGLYILQPDMQAARKKVLESLTVLEALVRRHKASSPPQ